MSMNMDAYYTIENLKIPILIIVGIAILILVLALIIKYFNKDRDTERC